MWPSKTTPRHTPPRTKTQYSHTDTHLIAVLVAMAKSSVSVNTYADKQSVVQPHSGVLLGLTGSEACARTTVWLVPENIMLPEEARCKRSQNVWFHIYEIFWLHERGKCTETECGGRQGLCVHACGMNTAQQVQGSHGKMKIFCNKIEVAVIQHSECAKCHYIVTFNWFL